MKKIFICLIAGLSLPSTLCAMDEYLLTVAAELKCQDAIIHSKTTEHALSPNSLRLKGWEEIPPRSPYSVTATIVGITPILNTHAMTVEYQVGQVESPDADPLFTSTLHYTMPAHYTSTHKKTISVDDDELLITIVVGKQKQVYPVESPSEFEEKK